MNLNTISIENPMILNGSKINQISGNKKISTIASGQQSTNKMHQRIRVARVLIEYRIAKDNSIIRPVFKTGFSKCNAASRI
jgi:hypothetical protein